MGASGSAPATPAAPRNKHLAQVTDPRSPTAGILRTPIEVVSSPAGSPQPSPAETPAGTGQERDPRSPTPGISRTPMRAVSSGDVDRLVKQLSEAFGAEAAAPEPAPPAAAGPAEEPAQRSSPPAGQGAERPPSPSAARPARPAGHGLSSGKSADAVSHGLGLWAVLPLLLPSLLPSSVPDLEETVPGASGNSHAIRRHPQAAHSVVVPRKDSCGWKEEVRQ
uniref:CDCA3 protein n=1 Tax=Zonotrichia albicollis TaxID=44394 RepID=A0A8D2NHJ9_ZONAL